MSAQICTDRLQRQTQVIHHYTNLVLTICVSNFISSVVTILGNLLVIHALWKAASIPANLKKMFLSLAFSDLAVGLFAQLMYGIIIAVMLKMATNSNYHFDYLCPTIITISYSSAHLLTYASFLNITAITVDRLLAVSLHLRYRELVTSKRVIISLVSLWLTSGLATTLYILLPKLNSVVTVFLQAIGFPLTVVAYIRIYQVVKYHQKQIARQLQLQYDQAVDLLREKKSAINALYVFIVFVVCYFPNLCAAMLLITNSSRTSFLAAYHVTAFIVLLNSSLNPIVYCWRYREIREIMKNTVNKIFRFHSTETGE